MSNKSLFILLKKAQAVVQKTSRKNIMSTVLIFSSFFYARYGWKNQLNLLAPESYISILAHSVVKM
jgi:hypothetical protein